MPDMKCERFHQNFENSPGGALNPGHLSVEMLAHINDCAECKDFVGRRRELALSFLRIRDACPEVPQSLDAAVLTAFRQRVATAGCEETPLPKRTGRVALYCSSVALLAAAAVIAFWALPTKKIIPNIRLVQTPQHMAARDSSAAASGSMSQAQIKQATARKKLVKKSSATPVISHDQSSFPSGFASLMYCDRLSCAGDMEIVRVQLTPSMLGLAGGQADAAGAVLADVLVGPDGIARGIRLEQ
jgi:hypothetical protein